MIDPTPRSGLPAPQGLYDPANERDSCGIGFVANIKGQKSHEIILKGKQVLINLRHGAACGSDRETGDAEAGPIKIRTRFLAGDCPKIGSRIREPGDYGWAMV